MKNRINDLEARVESLERYVSELRRTIDNIHPVIYNIQEKKVIIMYEELNCFEEALKHFGTRVEVICAMELGGRINAEDAYQMIKDEMKESEKMS